MRQSIVIVTKDRPALLADTLASLAGCAPQSAEVLVVDASDGEATRDVVGAAAAAHPALGLRYLRSAPGLCRQRNRGLDEAQGEIVVYLDDDVLLEPDALEQLLKPFEDPGVVGTTGKLVEPSSRRFSFKHSRLRCWLPGAGAQGTMTRSGYPNRVWSVDEWHTVETMSGCFMAARMDDARATRFDERLEAPNGYAFLDDEDFAYRLAQRGRLIYTPEARLVHRATGLRTSRAREFNRRLVIRRHYTLEKSFSDRRGAHAHWWLMMAIHVVHRAVNTDWQGARGLLDGLWDVARRRTL
ncbi:glycosyltransferase family 2 protein [Solirubrobacter sp. CPCC 204708]|uniref:Glycosyltransferase family 2 protein n=1 Tax=Solirubrobacter deserti TaxID=2282478 RepID=A0ABT4RRW7_9ACTN|nr:glycosyltransferase [Solirubrobacter deserti]MBE2318740.1 glycosyltransferase family 2 protein [Solirubrobacter deserti]MDA0141330.1 glycosyltransferase family 2 protein [Solirubrobacter deserti]